MTNIILSSFVVIGAASALFGFLALADGLNGVAFGFFALTICCIIAVRTFQ